MITPVLHCAACGSSDMRRSKRQSSVEAVQMIFGIYPFRCIECGARQRVSVWLLSKLGTAKCPFCLSTNLINWPEKYFRPNAYRNLLLTLGAHRYRCTACRYNFLSFRSRESDHVAKPVAT